jgi:hypothetical protein
MHHLEGAIDAIFQVALAAYKANRSIDGHRVAIKPYHQRRDIDVYAAFVDEWNRQSGGRWARAFCSAADDLAEALAN